MQVYTQRVKPISVSLLISHSHKWLWRKFWIFLSFSSPLACAPWQRNHRTCRMSTRSWGLIPTSFTGLRVRCLLPRGLDNRFIPSPKEAQNEALLCMFPWTTAGQAERLGCNTRCSLTAILMLKHCALATHMPCSFKLHHHMNIDETDWVQVGFALETYENMCFLCSFLIRRLVSNNLIIFI